MTALYISTAIICFLLLILLSTIRIAVLYETKLTVYVYFWFIRIKVFPSKNEGPIPEIYLRFLKTVYKKIMRYMSITLHRLYVTVATGNAAKTAILYGIATQSVAYMCELLYQNTNFRAKKHTSIRVTPDFDGKKSHIDCHVVVSLRIFRILHLLLYFLFKSAQEKKQTQE